MQKSKGTHIRIRDGNDYTTNIEDTIKEIEKNFHIDFRSLRNWQNVVKRLHVAQTDCQRKIQCANLQKAKIIEKLYIEATRPSPFQLNDLLARTACKWRNLGKSKIISVPPSVLSDEVVKEEEEQIELNEVGDDDFEALHPNTENSSADRAVIEPFKDDTQPSKVDAGVQYDLDSAMQTTINLPVFICTNTHKIISPLGSKVSPLSFHSITHHMEYAGESKIKEWQPCTSAVICNPTTVNIVNKSLKEQSVLFSLTNCTSEYLHVRFKYATNNSPFKRLKILPTVPKRLYPGIAKVFKFIFELQTQEEFKTGLYFRIGHDVYSNVPTEPLFIPVLGTFTSNLQVSISEIVNIPPAYPWHIKMGPESDFPTSIVKICSDEPSSYHLHIHKQQVDLWDESMLSIKPIGPDTEFFKECDSLLRSVTLQSTSSVKIDELTDKKTEPKTSETTEMTRINSTEMIVMIVDDIVQLALEAFIFDCTYIFLRPHSRISIPVYLSKAEHIGYHHSYFDLDIIDPDTNIVVATKTIKVLAEVLPHPITIAPLILDMSKSPVSHGYYEEQFIITNSHKLFPATIHIKLTTKMKKMFYVEPMKCVVPAQSSVPFEVKFCSRDYLSPEPCEDLVHFTFKIIVVGHKMVFKNVPPIFYEIIAPCAMEFKKIYNEKYFKEIEQLNPVSERDLKH